MLQKYEKKRWFSKNWLT